MCSAEGPRVQGDDQVNGAGPAEVRRLPEPEDVPPEAVWRNVPGAHTMRTRAEHHGQGGVPVPKPGGGPRQTGRRRARRRSVGTSPPAVLVHGRRLRAQRVRGRRVDRQVHVPWTRGMTAAAAVNRQGSAATATGRPRLGRTVNVTRFSFSIVFAQRSTRTTHDTHVHDIVI